MLVIKICVQNFIGGAIKQSFKMSKILLKAKQATGRNHGLFYISLVSNIVSFFIFFFIIIIIIIKNKNNIWEIISNDFIFPLCLMRRKRISMF